MDQQSSYGIRFRCFLLDRSAGGLFRLDELGHGTPVALGSRALDVLSILAERSGELVSKQAIMDAVWPETAVEENNLTVQISTLRRVLDEGRSEGSCIQTVPGRGYRFVFGIDDASRRWADTAERPALPLPDKPSLVVLPFRNMSGDPEQDYFCDGMADEITTALSRIRSLFIIARDSALTYKGRAVDVRQVGRELGVRYVLEGSVRKVRSRVRISGRLIEAATGAHLWADRFEGTLEDVFDLQDQVTISVVGATVPNIRSAEVRRAEHKPTESLQAYGLILRTDPLLVRRTRENLTEAECLLQTAINLDPRYALALARLALCHWIMVSQNWADRADPAVNDMVHLARAALVQAPSDPEVLRVAGFILHFATGDRIGGIALLNRAIELNPNSAIALQMAALLHAYTGDTHLVIALLERAARLDPINLTIDFYSAYAISHFAAGQFEATVEWTTKAFEYFPSDTAFLRYRAAGLGLLGRIDEGRQVVQRLLALVPGFSITQARRHVEFGMNSPFRPGIADTLYEGLRRCGVPE